MTTTITRTAAEESAYSRKEAREVRAIEIKGSTPEKRELAQGLADVFAQFHEKRAKYINVYGSDDGFGEAFFSSVKIGMDTSAI